MTQALNIIEPQWQGIGNDMLLTGYLPASGGLEALDATLSGQQILQAQSPAHQQNGHTPSSSAADLLLGGKARRRKQSDASKVLAMLSCMKAYSAKASMPWCSA